MLNQQFATALHIMAVLAYMEGRLVSSKELSKSLYANPVTVRRIIGLLVKVRLVETVRGPSGGVRLSRSPKATNLAEIYFATEPVPFVAKREQKSAPDCPVGCRVDVLVSDLSSEIAEQVVAFLEKVTLSDAVEKLGQIPGSVAFLDTTP
jgi:Rrf2 family protein